MSKWTSFATGMGEGYLAGKRYQDTKKRSDKQDALLEKMVDSRVKLESAQAKGTDPSVAPMATPADPVIGPAQDPNDYLAAYYGGSAKRYASGGMIGEMPSHHDKMQWQRGIFKK